MAAFCVYAQIFIMQSIKCSFSVSIWKEKCNKTAHPCLSYVVPISLWYLHFCAVGLGNHCRSLPPEQLCSLLTDFYLMFSFFFSWMTSALEFLKEIPHLKQILDAEIALSYPRRKLLKQWQTLSVPYWYSFHKQVKKLASKIKPRAIFSPISSNRKRRLMLT